MTLEQIQKWFEESVEVLKADLDEGYIDIETFDTQRERLVELAKMNLRRNNLDENAIS